MVWTGLKKLSFRQKLPPEARVHFDEIVKHFKNSGPGRPTSVSELEELKRVAPMSPCRTNLWTASFGDIEPFLVSDFSPPSVIRARNVELETESTVFTSVHLSFYDMMGGSMVARLAGLMNGTSTDLTIKILDQLGAIVEVWKMVVRPIAIHPLVVLDYAQAEPIKWQLECECSKWDIQVVDDEQNYRTMN